MALTLNWPDYLDHIHIGPLLFPGSQILKILLMASRIPQHRTWYCASPNLVTLWLISLMSALCQKAFRGIGKVLDFLNCNI